MKKFIIRSAGLWIVAIFAIAGSIYAVPQGATTNANFVGTWHLTMEAGGNSGNGGNGGEQTARRGGRAQSLTISQDGNSFKVMHTTPRGENTYDATVSGNTISWTELRQRRNGGTINVQFTATLEGDTLKGSMAAGRFNRDFTASRAQSTQ